MRVWGRSDVRPTVSDASLEHIRIIYSKTFHIPVHYIFFVSLSLAMCILIGVKAPKGTGRPSRGIVAGPCPKRAAK